MGIRIPHQEVPGLVFEKTRLGFVIKVGVGVHRRVKMRGRVRESVEESLSFCVDLFSILVYGHSGKIDI